MSRRKKPRHEVREAYGNENERQHTSKKENKPPLTTTMGKDVETENSMSNGNKYSTNTVTSTLKDRQAAAEAFASQLYAQIKPDGIQLHVKAIIQPAQPQEQEGYLTRTQKKPLIVPSSGRAQEIANSLAAENEYLWSNPSRGPNQGRKIAMVVHESETELYNEVLGDTLKERGIGLYQWKGTVTTTDYGELELPRGYGAARAGAQSVARELTAEYDASNKRCVMIDDQIEPNSEAEDGYQTDVGEAVMLTRARRRQARVLQEQRLITEKQEARKQRQATDGDASTWRQEKQVLSSVESEVRIKAAECRILQRSDMYYGLGVGAHQREAWPEAQQYGTRKPAQRAIRARPPEQAVVVGDNAPYDPLALGGGEDIQQSWTQTERELTKGQYKKIPLDTARSQDQIWARSLRGAEVEYVPITAAALTKREWSKGSSPGHSGGEQRAPDPQMDQVPTDLSPVKTSLSTDGSGEGASQRSQQGRKSAPRSVTLTDVLGQLETLYKHNSREDGEVKTIREVGEILNSAGMKHQQKQPVSPETTALRVLATHQAWVAMHRKNPHDPEDIVGPNEVEDQSPE